MAIRVICRKCKKAYQLADHLGGKRIRCKACQALIAVPAPEVDEDERDEDEDEESHDNDQDEDEDEDDDDDEEEDRRRRRKSKKRSKSSGGLPGWAWGAIGGGGALLVIIIVVVIILATRGGTPPGKGPVAVGPGVPDPGPGPAQPVPQPQPPNMTHMAVLEELNSSVVAVTEQLAAANNPASAERLSQTLASHAIRLNRLADQIEKMPIPTPDIKRKLNDYGRQIDPAAKKFTLETNKFRARIPSMNLPQDTLQRLDTNMRNYGLAMLKVASSAQRWN